MTAITIKFFFIYFFSFYICFKLVPNISHKRKFYVPVVASLFLGILTYLLGRYFLDLKHILPLLFLWTTINFYYFTPQLSFVATIISFGLSYCLFATSSFFIDVVTSLLLGKFLSYTPLALLSAILQYSLILLLFKVKRFRKGMTFLSNSKKLNIATFLCLLFVISLVYVTTNNKFLFGINSAILLLAFLIYWWQAQITKAYRRRLELRELESLRTEVTELNLVIARLTEENEKLARITHRDNTLITTLKNSAIKYLSTDFKNPAEAVATRDKLISNINALSTDRTALSTDSLDRKARHFDTGLPLLDELLGHMDEKAIEQNITFSVHLATVLTDFVPKDISESALVHTVDDLLKNAFKATTTCEKRNVQLQFYKLGKHFVVEVADNGIPFEIKSLVNMGLEKITTYADGSGIGLVDIWTTKEKYGATYHLDEYTSHPSFTKKISLTFDKKNLYSIRTWRKDEVLQISKRTDLQVYDYSE